MAVLGVDFGTSNSAAAVAFDGRPWVIPLEDGRDMIPTAVFADFDRRDLLFGHAAVAALTGGRDGRFLRALKRILGTPLFHEPRQLLNRRLTLADLVTAFLLRIREAAQAATGQTFDAAVAGRPVRFHDGDPDRDRAAEADLAACYRAAGFAEVRFLAEPEAAALAAGAGDGLGLVVDIGGGTSDFTLFRSRPGGIEVLASRGVRVGGTDADRLISLGHVMPLLGLGQNLRAVFGPALHEVPVHLFHDLATWEKIAFLYSPENRRAAADYRRMAVQPAPFDRLCKVLRDETGHDLAFAVERAKIALGRAPASIEMTAAGDGPAPRLTPADLERDLAGMVASIRATAEATLAAGGLAGRDVDRLVLVGGSSLLAPVRAAMADLCPRAAVADTAAFSAVVAGLGLAAAGVRS